MRKLSFLIFLFAFLTRAQSPHGKNFSLDCAQCHQPESWQLQNNPAFDHSTTKFTLQGRHTTAACRQCHTTLVFEEAKPECSSCHKDVHRGTVTPECSKCHTPANWLVTRAVPLHQTTRFQLQGVHAQASCQSCHSNYTTLNFTVLGVACYDCHAQQYAAAQNPNHEKAGFAKQCESCHKVTSASWRSGDFRHDFFPLVGAHKLENCYQCHNQSSFKGLQKQCFSCHADDYAKAIAPNHAAQNFSKECQTCHSTNAWKPSAFNHSTTAFPLTGAHLSAACSSCHGNFTSTPASGCYSCHKAKYDATTNPKHSSTGFNQECKTCHTTNAWQPASFNHDGPFFPINSGKHQGKWNACSDCHTSSGNYAVFSCTNCHEHAKTSMDNEHRGVGGYTYQSTACFNCHPRGSENGAFNHSTSQFPLTGSHTVTTCEQCHTTGFSNKPATDCKSCHAAQAAQAVNPNHALNGMSQICSDCHNTTDFKQSLFNHQTATQFPLTGRHVSATCNDCHTVKFSGTSKICSDCHAAEAQNAVSVNHQLANFTQACSECHTVNGWKPANYTHTNTFALTGKHGLAFCKDCHTTGYTNTDKQCKSCHINDYNQTNNPKHSAVQFNQECQECHTSTAWQPATFNHDGPFFPINSGEHKGKWNTCGDCHTDLNNYAKYSCTNCHEHQKPKMDSEHQGVQGYLYESTACLNCHPRGTETGAFNHSTSLFPLTGSHTTTTCDKCHVNGYSSKPATACKSCHATQANLVVNPNHALPGMSEVCSDCHNTANFKQNLFNHQAATQFPLTGKHVTATCNDCHSTSYTGTTKVCKECHQSDFQSASSVNHSLAGFTQACSECHATTGWKPSSFSHTTAFILTGKHTTTACADCHQAQYANTEKTCKSCHLTDYNQTSNPKHTAAQFNQQCQDCHNTNKWNESTYNHEQRFPIKTGKHAGTWQLCTECHSNNSYASFSCIGCHEHAKPETDNQHLSVSGYLYSSTECKACHPTGTKTGSFNHAQSIFPLTGAHRATACNQCHISGYSQKPSTECRICHNNDLQTANNPKHTVGNFPQTCQTCHTTTAWKPSTFNHTTGTQYPLQGAHINASCNTCHTSTYAGLTKICKECHNEDFQQAVNPNHTLANFTQPCEQCHTPQAWKPSSYNHSVTGYQLVGSHVNTACNKCHAQQYANTSTVCFSCHAAAYNSSTTPNHGASNIPNDCKLCHTPANWTTLSVYTQHDATYFPVFSGEHRGEWNKCTECHTNPANYSTFSCIDCHEHNQASTNSEHRNVVGYVYQSAQCYHCHPRGNTVNAFNHATGSFPLTGAHLAVSCDNCHASGYAGTPTSCQNCHQSTYNNAQNPNHAAAGISLNCNTCHTSTAWTPSTFNHSATVFALTGSHLNTACSSCHIGSTTGTSTQCKGCHLAQYQSTVNPNHAALTFSQDCQTCHTTTGNWKPATFPVHATYWAFQGAHVTIKDNCGQCHNGNYQNTPNTCYGCHQTKFTATTKPPHVQYNFSQVCTNCHTQSAWTPATFNHGFYSISTKHRNVTCNQCHSLSGYTPQCLSCHQTAYRRGHNSTGHPNCYQCHNTSSFDDKMMLERKDSEK